MSADRMLELRKQSLYDDIDLLIDQMQQTVTQHATLLEHSERLAVAQIEKDLRELRNQYRSLLKNRHRSGSCWCEACINDDEGEARPRPEGD